MLAVELATQESELSWTEFLRGLKARGLHGVEFVVSDSLEGLKQAIGKVLTRAHWQRYCVHFLRNASDKLPRRVERGCLDGLKRLYQYEDLTAARAALKDWVNRWGDVAGYRRLVDWVEENVEETFTVYLLPAGHRRRMKSTNMLERAQRRDPSSDAGGAHLSERGLVSTTDTGAIGRDAREMVDRLLLSHADAGTDATIRRRE